MGKHKSGSSEVRMDLSYFNRSWSKTLKVMLLLLLVEWNHLEVFLELSLLFWEREVISSLLDTIGCSTILCLRCGCWHPCKGVLLCVPNTDYQHKWFIKRVAQNWLISRMLSSWLRIWYQRPLPILLHQTLFLFLPHR